MGSGLEIERKFVLDSMPDAGDPTLAGARRFVIEQTYLAGAGGESERVRLVREQGAPVRYFHTVKRRLSSLTREEDEREISHSDYLQLLVRRDPERRTVRKTRHVFRYAGRVFELDQFDAPPGLVLLEVELPSENESVELPPFAGLSEVTGDPRYSNAELARRA